MKAIEGMNINDFKRHLNCFRRKRQREVVKKNKSGKKINQKRNLLDRWYCSVPRISSFLKIEN